jgi:hypothetical protein
MDVLQVEQHSVHAVKKTERNSSGCCDLNKARRRLCTWSAAASDSSGFCRALSNLSMASFPPPAFTKRSHSSFARRRVAVRRRAIPVLPVGQSPQGASFGAARSVDKRRFVIVPTAGRGHWDVARPGVESSEKEKTLTVQG